MITMTNARDINRMLLRKRSEENAKINQIDQKAGLGPPPLQA